MNSKWSYLLSGVNLVFAFLGAVSGSFPLLAIGVVFGIFNWHVGEKRREMEEAELLKNKEEQENGENNEEDEQ
jgi:flagellar biosynthesis component FlhA